MVAIGIALAMVQSHASDEIWDRRIVVCDVVSAPIRSVLADICKEAGVRLKVDPDVDGTVTMLLRNQKFELVLQNVLAQVGATYEVTSDGLQVHQQVRDRIALAVPTFAFRLSSRGLPSNPSAFEKALFGKVGRFCEMYSPMTGSSKSTERVGAYFFNPAQRNMSREPEAMHIFSAGLDLRFPEVQLAQYMTKESPDATFAVLRFDYPPARKGSNSASSKKSEPGIPGSDASPSVELYIYEMHTGPNGRLKLTRPSERTVQQAWKALDSGGWIKRSELKSLSPVLVR